MKGARSLSASTPPHQLPVNVLVSLTALFVRSFIYSFIHVRGMKGEGQGEFGFEMLP